MSHLYSSSQFLDHLHPPRWPKPSHSPHNDRAARRNYTDPSEQPSIPNHFEKRLGDDSADAGENVADEVVDGDAGGGFAGHEFREHGGGHAKDEHGADAENEICNKLAGG